MTRQRPSAVYIAVRDINYGFGTYAEVRRVGSHRLVYRTIRDRKPVPYGARRAAVCQALDWCIANEYTDVNEGERGLGV